MHHIIFAVYSQSLTHSQFPILLLHTSQFLLISSQLQIDDENCTNYRKQSLRPIFNLHPTSSHTFITRTTSATLMDALNYELLLLLSGRDPLLIRRGNLLGSVRYAMRIKI
jgi:hypothetical protein